MRTDDAPAPTDHPVSSGPQPGDHPGCDDYRLSRRRFLTATGAAVATTVVGDTVRQVAFGPPSLAGPNNVLVVLSMRGGVDGLSLVVPHAEPNYYRSRPRIAVPRSVLWGRDDTFGFHPALRPLRQMWRERRLAAVHAVGLPVPNRSHFVAMEEMEDADPRSAERRGWINRMVGMTAFTRPVEGTHLGHSIVPTSLYGSEPSLATRSLDSIALPGPSDAASRRRQRTLLDGLWDDTPGPLGRGARSALACTTQLRSVASSTVRVRNGATYPDGPLGRTMAETAHLIRAQVGARVVTVDHGSWDHHTSIGDHVEWGRFLAMAEEFARALRAFFVDLGTAGDRVTLVTMSEFGRRLGENGAWGTDHGWGNVMLVAGAGVRGRRYHGRWPGLAPNRLVDGDLRVTRDHRSVLHEVVRTRFPAMDASRVFPGFTPEPIGVMQGA